jgi:hypothetical protein
MVLSLLLLALPWGKKMLMKSWERQYWNRNSSTWTNAVLLGPPHMITFVWPIRSTYVRFRLWTPVGIRDFLSSSPSNPLLRPTQRPVQSDPALLPRVKRPERRAGDPPHLAPRFRTCSSVLLSPSVPSRHVVGSTWVFPVLTPPLNTKHPAILPSHLTWQGLG